MMIDAILVLKIGEHRSNCLMCDVILKTLLTQSK